MSVFKLFALAVCASAAPAAKPNLIFLLLDDMDSMLGALDVMPHTVSHFRDNGMEFKNGFASTPKVRGVEEKGGGRRTAK